MQKEYLMGNEAIAMGAIAAGVNVAAGYPGTPSTEVLETIAKRRTEDIYVEWSVNEKAALELGAGAAYSGARVLVTMKQVGLNVAADPLMSLEYIGVKGGLVILVADDPGPISSQTEQDTRTFAAFSKVPCFDPSSVQEAYEMVQEAFAYSEKYHTPVFLRPTTRVCHGYAAVDMKGVNEYEAHRPDGFVRDTKRWVIFPRLSYQNHLKIEERNVQIADDFSLYHRNKIVEAKEAKKGVVTSGVSFTYVAETLKGIENVRILKIGTPFPFPEKLAVEFLTGLDEVLCIEELDPVLEREMLRICGKYHLPVKICGKLSHHVKQAGENTRRSVKQNIYEFLGMQMTMQNVLEDAPNLPVRPPVLCAGCPHRASFYAVKQAMRGKKSVFCGDIGCYTLGNAMPLDMVDTCLCMGAGINIAQGIGKVKPDTACFAFVGDSTFFASAITGIVNAVYNQANLTVVILDNSTTAMTGHQPHPGTGRTMMGEIVQRVNIEAVLRGIGLEVVETVNPLELEHAIRVVKETAERPGVKAIIFKAPCIAVVKPEQPLHVTEDTCIHCKKCIRELGCPAIILKGGQVNIDTSLCTGCGLCRQVCPVHAITGGDQNE